MLSLEHGMTPIVGCIGTGTARGWTDGDLGNDSGSGFSSKISQAIIWQ
jgi:hypothetical protein